MNRIKQEIKNELISNIFITSMLFMQLLLCFTLCSYAFISSYDINEQSKKFANTYESKDFIRVWDAFYNDSEEYFLSQPNYIGKMETVYNKMSNSKIINFFSEYNNPVNIVNAPDNFGFSYTAQFDADPDTFVLEDYGFELTSYDGKNDIYYDVKGIWIDSKGLDYFGISPAWGRGFNSDDYIFTRNGDTVPIIMGYNYKEYYNIGDIMKADIYYANVNFEVIGFFDKDTAIKMVISGSSGFERLDDYIVLPLCDPPNEITEENTFELFDLYEFKICGYAYTDHSPDIVQAEVANICKDVGFEPVLQVAGSTNYESAEMALDIHRLAKIFMIISVILLLFSIFTIIVFIVSYLRKNLKYYAVLLMNGYTYKNIFCIILSIPLITDVSAVLLSVIFVFFICDISYINIIIRCIISILIIGISIVCISSTVIYNELKKHDLAQYLRKR